MKCVLTVPNVSGNNIRIGLGNNEFLGIQYIAAALEKNNIECDVINAHAYKYSNEEVVSIICDKKYELAGISCPSQKCYIFARDLIRKLRKRNYCGKIILGGFYATICYQEILVDIPEIDCICLGEGELVFPQLVKNIMSGVGIETTEGIAFVDSNDFIKYSYPHRITDLDELAFPVRDINVIGDSDDTPEVGMNMCEGRFFRMTVGRGCYGRCSFCSILDFYKECKTRYYRSAANVVDEIETLISKYNVNNFRFNDDIFYESSKKGLEWVHLFCNEIKKRKLKITFAIEMRANDVHKEELQALKEVGLKKMSIGVESGVQRLLDEMRKDYTVTMLKEKIQLIRECGITPSFSFITIVPTMTFEELETNYKFIEELECFAEKNLYNQLNVYTGCGYEEILAKEGLLLPKENFYDRHNYIFKDVRVKHFSVILDNVVSASKKIKSKYLRIWHADEEFYVKYDEYHERRKHLILMVIKRILKDLKCATDEVFDYDNYSMLLMEEYRQQFERLDVDLYEE